jgi:3-oxoacyl-[acyl-carrier protein] reductase
MGDRRIALVTGASKGIGAAIAAGLARDGFDLWINYRSNHGAAEEVKKIVEQIGRHCRLLPFDVSDPEAAQDVLYPLLEEETPDILVNNAGCTRDMLMIWMSQQDWQDVLSVTLDGFFQITKGVIKGMLRKRNGRIINIVSTSGQSGMPGQVNYATAKAGLIGATKALAAEVAKRNILVNAVSPGFIETEMTKDVPKDKVLPLIPLQRFGTTEEVADVVRFLCSDQASYITGQVIGVNGGIYM